MVLSADSAMRTVFMVFAAFWIVVIGVLLIGVGVLLKRSERLAAKHAHGESGGHH